MENVYNEGLGIFYEYELNQIHPEVNGTEEVLFEFEICAPSVYNDSSSNSIHYIPQNIIDQSKMEY